MASTQAKIEQHSQFWNGQGPSLILTPTAQMPQYDTAGYSAQFKSPARMWESEMRRARPVADWPTDGIPTVRPNLGVIFIPGVAGQAYTVQDGAMPWPSKQLSRTAIRGLRELDVVQTKLLNLALEFYEIHREQGGGEIIAYHPDTQGIFSLAHLLNGDPTFVEVVDDPPWMHELLEIALDLHRRVVCLLKSRLGEAANSMIHGHGSPQGVYFPHAGVRISEDTATMLSPKMVDEFVLPYLERAIAPFGGAFVHFCGHHLYLFERLCTIETVRAIDLGNPEMYDTRWLLEKCGESGTVLFSPVAARDGEPWETYIRRLATLAKATGARLILRPLIFPETREECARMQELWHDLTS